MADCPACEAPLDQDFGMVTCQNCNAVLMIDYSGKIQMGSEVAENSTEAQDHFDDVEEHSQFNSQESLTDDESMDSNEDSTLDDSESWSAESHDETLDENNFFGADDGAEELGEGIEEESANFSDWSEESAEGAEVDEPSDVIYADGNEQEEVYEEEVIEEGGPTSELDFVESEQEEFSMASEADDEPVDISDFANSEESNLEGGEFLYDLTISGLDSKKMREALKYTLMDEKLKLNHHEFLNAIHGGRVIITDLNPLKTKRIVEQLQFMDLEMSWKQKRVVMVETEAVDEGSDEGEELQEYDDAEV